MSEEEAVALVYSDAPPHAPVVVEESLSPAALLMRCQQLHTADKVAEKRKSLFGLLGGLAIGATVLAVFAGAISEVAEILIGAAVFGALAVVLFVVRSILGRADIDDRKLHVASRLVDALRPELHKKRPVKLWMDFAGYEKSMKDSSVSLFGGSGTKLYVKPWLRMSFVLLDGTEVALHARTTCKRKQKAKRKYTKIKDSVVDELNLFVKPPSSVALDPSATPRVHAAMGGPSPIPRPKGVKVKPRMVQMSFRWGPGRRLRGRGGWSSSGLSQLLDGDKALGVVMMGYRAMRAARSA